MAIYDATVGHISTQANIANGKPCITGTRIRVQDVYVWHEVLGQNVDDIASEYNLSLAQVYAALTYTFDHLEDIRRAIRGLGDFINTLKQKYPSKLPKNISSY
jgi:uncharacterized protein (DUF433 family)